MSPFLKGHTGTPIILYWAEHKAWYEPTKLNVVIPCPVLLDKNKKKICTKQALKDRESFTLKKKKNAFPKSTKEEIKCKKGSISS